MLMTYLQVLVASILLIPSLLRKRKTTKKSKMTFLDKYYYNLGPQKNILNGVVLCILFYGYVITNERLKNDIEESILKSTTSNILKSDIFQNTRLPFITLNNDKPIQINALVVDTNFDPDVVFGSKRNQLYNQGYSSPSSITQNAENEPSLSNYGKQNKKDLDIQFKQTIDNNKEFSPFEDISSPFSPPASISGYIDDALNGDDFGLEELTCNGKDLCDNLFSSLDEVERNNDFHYEPSNGIENVFSSEFEVIEREMSNNPHDPLSLNFDPYMYDKKMAPKELDILNGNKRKYGKSVSESENKRHEKKKVTIRKESSVPIEINGDMSLRPEYASETFAQSSRSSSCNFDSDNDESQEGRKKSGRVSRDNELLIENKINISPADLRDFTLREFKSFVKRERLSQSQEALCRSIRRRGKLPMIYSNNVIIPGRNKIAAKKVRTNKIDKKRKNYVETTSDTRSVSSFNTIPYFPDPQPTPSRARTESLNFRYTEYEFSDDLLDVARPLYQIHDVENE
uniref:BZIP domain-containing protein n=1 Tax=Parastrongyloides trichosuri TaxID=131310 RepID=A0A0N5A3V5_PARTI